MPRQTLPQRPTAGGPTFGLAALATVLALLAVEAIVRLADPPIASLHRGLIKYGELQVYDRERDLLTGPAGADVVLFGHRARFNSLGMRDREPEVPKPAGRRRVLLLGDSMVFGQGVAQEDTVAEVLRAELAGSAVDVVAAGVPGWRTIDEEQFLEKLVAALEPDLVAVLYVENDNEPSNPFMRARQPARGLGARLYRALLLNSRAFEWAAYIYRSRIAGPDRATLDDARSWEARVAAQGPPFAPEDRGWIASRAALLRMQRLLAARGARLVVFLYDLGTIAADAPIHQRFRELEEAGEIPVFRTRPFFAGIDPASLMNAPVVDPHPNARGHELLGRGMARTLREHGLLGPEASRRQAADGAR